MTQLIACLRDRFGEHALRPFGDGDDPESAGFRVEGMALTFSVRAVGGLLDVQIESIPQGEYLYTGRLPLGRFLEVVNRLAGPRDQWP